jgi:hypothetical protein
LLGLEGAYGTLPDTRNDPWSIFVAGHRGIGFAVFGCAGEAGLVDHVASNEAALQHERDVVCAGFA